MSRRHSVIWTTAHVAIIGMATWVLVASEVFPLPLLFSLH